jgi:hypothetical protein
MALLPISKALIASRRTVEGVVRDSYNHIVAITYRARAGIENSPLVVVPVVDDGIVIGRRLHIHLDWTDVNAAPFNEIVEFYKEEIESLFSLYPGYRPKYAVMTKDSGKRIEAIQLENGIYIPCAPVKAEGDVSLSGVKAEGDISLPIVEIEQLEWSINQALASDCGSMEDVLPIRKASVQQMEELYQHFRMMVANWLVSTDAGPGTRKSIERVIFNHILPEYEKRKRLDIMLTGVFVRWFAISEEEWEMPVSFLRKDCRVIDTESACSGACKWVSGKCLLHINKEAILGDSRRVSTAYLYIKRVIDELVRFPNRRMEILRRDISELSSAVKAIRYDDQYIIPENVPSPFSILQLEWTKQISEMPQFYEEMSAEADADADAETSARAKAEINRGIADIIADSSLDIWMPERDSTIEEIPLYPLTPVLGITLQEWGVEPSSRQLSDKDLKRYVQLTRNPIGLIDTFKEPTRIEFVRPLQGIYDSVVIIVTTPNGVGLLREYEGVPGVRITSLPPILREAWNNSTRLLVRRQKRADVTEATGEKAKPATIRLRRKRLEDSVMPVPAVPAVPSPAPAVPSPAPAVPSPVPAVPSPVPAVPSPAPAVPSPVPAVPSPAPAVASPVPVVPLPAPAVASPAPAVPSPVPVIENNNIPSFMRELLEEQAKLDM